MNKCKFESCNIKTYAKGLCRKHYRQSNREYEKRWLAIKNDIILYNRFRKSRRKYLDRVQSEDWFKEKANIRQRRHYRLSKKRKGYLLEYRFDGLREVVIKRDKKKCVVCGITRKEHIEKYSKDLIVHHINNKGRAVKREQVDNNLENLETICLSCHKRRHLGKI